MIHISLRQESHSDFQVARNYKSGCTSGIARNAPVNKISSRGPNPERIALGIDHLDIVGTRTKCNNWATRRKHVPLA
jgi:hypothetical protein